jgi:D-sedoheptulose 7-phosphate isomerase
MIQKLVAGISASVEMKKILLADEDLLKRVTEIVTYCVERFRQDGKLLFCGNGGSAADAQHLAAELSGRFYLDRPGLFAEALHVNSSFLTAMSNDYGYEAVFARMVQVMGRPGDVLFALSTSGNSPNVIEAIHRARKEGLKVVGMTGESGGKMKDLCDWWLPMPSADTPRIQEGHMLIGHLICQLIEAEVFGK